MFAFATAGFHLPLAVAGGSTGMCSSLEHVVILRMVIIVRLMMIVIVVLVIISKTGIMVIIKNDNKCSHPYARGKGSGKR